MIYLDTSFLLPLFREEPSSRQVERFLVKHSGFPFAVSQWTRVEFASAMSRDVRMKTTDAALATTLIEEFDALVNRSFHLLHPTVSDYDLAREFVSVFATKLRGPDALHLAIARNRNTEEFLSLDDDLLIAAKRLRIKARRGIRGGRG